MTGHEAMNRARLLFAALVVLGSLGFIGYSFFPGSRPDPVPAQFTAPPQQSAPAAAAAPAPPPAPSADQAATWIIDATGDDPAARATAIPALAALPPALALPVLQNVLRAGDPSVDRPLALQSLRALAIDTGDADGSIRGLLREAIYHGDDPGVVQAAQSTLDDIEGYLDELNRPAETPAPQRPRG